MKRGIVVLPWLEVSEAFLGRTAALSSLRKEEATQHVGVPVLILGVGGGQEGMPRCDLPSLLPHASCEVILLGTVTQ